MLVSGRPLYHTWESKLTNVIFDMLSLEPNTLILSFNSSVQVLFNGPKHETSKGCSFSVTWGGSYNCNSGLLVAWLQNISNHWCNTCLIIQPLSNSPYVVFGRSDFPFHDDWKLLPVKITTGSITLPEALPEAANTVIFSQPAPEVILLATFPLEQSLYIFQHLWENLILLDSIFARKEIFFRHNFLQGITKPNDCKWIWSSRFPCWRYHVSFL